ncbi:transposase family protein [Streptomyces sp. NBC_00111]|uniref:transposase family protein n=1 Tax=unclassified Streptomyces TaxID=2593676 RepID=UPI003866D578
MLLEGTFLADKGYRGVGGNDPHPLPGPMGDHSTGEHAVNRSHATIHALVEQGMATLKCWRLLRKLRCSTTKITDLVQAVLTLHLATSDR